MGRKPYDPIDAWLRLFPDLLGGTGDRDHRAELEALAALARLLVGVEPRRYRDLPVPPPCTAEPGPDKVAVLAERFRRRLALFTKKDPSGPKTP